MNTQIIEYRIGRNIGNTPMSDAQWAQFIDDARVSLLNAGNLLDIRGTYPVEFWAEVHTGTGTWTAKDGTVVREESAVISLYLKTDVNTARATADISRIVGDLTVHAGTLGRLYSQDAVAVMVGTPNLVKADVELPTAAEMPTLFPIGTMVTFLGYNDPEVGYPKTFKVGEVLEVVGYQTGCGDDGLSVRNAAGKQDMVFSTEVANS